jgi:hypothetical protein
MVFLTVVDPDLVRSETFSRMRIRIRKKSFRIRAASDRKGIEVKLL